MPLHDELLARLVGMGDAAAAAGKAAYFGTGGTGRDRFLGVSVPQLRRLSAANRARVSLPDVEQLLLSEWHEARLLGAILLVDCYQRAEPDRRDRLVALLLRRLDRLDNWDLVDTAVPKSLGRHLADGRADLGVLEDLASATSPWRRRAAAVATLTTAREGLLDPSMRVSELLLYDEHDLVRKGVGWVLREVGMRDRARLDTFLDQHAATMPRVMLRYAVEKHARDRRQHYLGLHATAG